MDFIIEQHGPVLVVRIAGSVDAHTAGEVTRVFQEQIAQGHYQLVADLHQIDFMSSAGLRAILAILKDARQRGGDFRLAAPQPGIEKILQISGFTTIVQTFPHIEAAVGSFQKVQHSDETKA